MRRYLPEKPLSPSDVAERISRGRLCVALTGAGISTAAGIPDFRGPGGLYETMKYDPQRVFDIHAFRADPTEFYRFTRDFVDALENLRPTLTHRFLASAERAGYLEAVITQNIDPLHAWAGTEKLLALHGDYSVSRCDVCGREYDFEEMVRRMRNEGIPRCDCQLKAPLKPEVVFFGEPVRNLAPAMDLIQRSDLLLVLGSSLAVSPASLLPEAAGGEVIVVNKGTVALSRRPGRFFIQADLDEFFDEVARRLDGVDVGT
jgi:NAD-dependent deacetylase